ncbi:hypothetical protein [Agrobacterium bohemicum]|nr:hypothetical protein [Agrobacterium bohemicum]
MSTRRCHRNRVVCGQFCSWIKGVFRPDIFNIDVDIKRDGWLATEAAKTETAVRKHSLSMTPSETFAYFAAAQHVGRVMINPAAFLPSDGK